MNTTSGLRVLLVEDDMRDASLLHGMFSKEAPGSFCLTQVTKMSEAESYLATGVVDLILLDLGLPDASGLATLRRARAAAPEATILVFSGAEDESLALAAIMEGAQDYLVKGQVESRALPRALRHTIELQRKLTETRAAREAQLQLRDEFLSHVSHELRGPLTAVYSFATIIADGLAGETTGPQDAYLQNVVKNVEQVRGMIEELLTVTRARAVKLGVAELPGPAAMLAEETGDGFAKIGEVRLPFGLPPVPPTREIIAERGVLKIGGVF